MNIDKLLNQVEKPTRYIGNEINAVYKDLERVKLRYLHSFPDVYDVGMSHLGSHILYGVVNEEPDIYCERLYAPWVDMEALMLKYNMPLFSIETQTPIAQFDVVGFTLQYELSYTNILHMLRLGGIDPDKTKRSAGDPLIIAGGPCAYNPEPLADIVDVFLIGEGEALLVDFLNYIKDNKDALPRAELLAGAAQMPGVYVPQLYDVEYDEIGRIQSFQSNDSRAPQKIVKQIVRDLNTAYYPHKMLVPFGSSVHNRAVVEVFRGCTAGCRFCQAGMIYRPVREKSVETIVETTSKILEETGYEEVALSSLSTLDHSGIERIIEEIMAKHEGEKVGVSLPSLRLDSLSVKVLNDIQKVRKTGLTFAPEAGTQRLRNVINKGVSEDDIYGTLENVFALGWQRVKLYFMMGLPTETMADIEGIVEIARKVKAVYQASRSTKKALSLTMSTSVFVPKGFTPFQWYGQEGIATIREKQRYLKEALKALKVTYNYHDVYTSRVEAIFARGDRRLGKVLLRAEQLGCKYDGWEEFFDYEKWQQAMTDCGLEIDFYANRERGQDEILPWDHIDCGVTKAFLQREYDRAKRANVTINCRERCVNCGVNSGMLNGNCKW